MTKHLFYALSLLSLVFLAGCSITDGQVKTNKMKPTTYPWKDDKTVLVCTTYASTEYCTKADREAVTRELQELFSEY